MPLCAVCGKEVGERYARDTLNDLVYCATHTHLSSMSSDVRVCQQCGQRVSGAFYSEDLCPRCGANFQEAAQTRYEATLTPTLERLKKIGPTQFIVFDLLSCIVVGSILFLVVHFVGRLITPVVAAVILLIAIVPPLVHTIWTPAHKWNILGTFAIFSRVLDLIASFGLERIEKSFVGREYVADNVLETQVREGFLLSSTPFSGASTLARLLMLTAATLLVELFWPGYFHNLIITAAIAIPSSVVDAILFQRIMYPTIRRKVERK